MEKKTHLVVDPSVHKELKIRAAKKEKKLNTMVNEILRNFLDQFLPEYNNEDNDH